jgi:hypothetical protein
MPMAFSNCGFASLMPTAQSPAASPGSGFGLHDVARQAEGVVDLTRKIGSSFVS